MRKLGILFIATGLVLTAGLLAIALSDVWVWAHVAPRLAYYQAAAAVLALLFKPLVGFAALALHRHSLGAAVGAVALVLGLGLLEWFGIAPDWAFKTWPIFSALAGLLPPIGTALILQAEASTQAPADLDGFLRQLRSLARSSANADITPHSDGEGLTASQPAISKALGMAVGSVNARLRALDEAGLIDKSTGTDGTTVRFRSERRLLH